MAQLSSIKAHFKISMKIIVICFPDNHMEYITVDKINDDLIGIVQQIHAMHLGYI